MTGNKYGHDKDDDTNARGISDASAAGSGASAGGASGASGNVGTSAGTQESTSKAFEGSTKQASDIGTEESLAVLQTIVAANAKRTYDAYQTQDLQEASGHAEYKETMRNLTSQALQNAIETSNMVAKQAVRHNDIAIDRQWNVDEQGYQVAEILRDEVFKQAVAAEVARAVQTDRDG